MLPNAKLIKCPLRLNLIRLDTCLKYRYYTNSDQDPISAAIGKLCAFLAHRWGGLAITFEPDWTLKHKISVIMQSLEFTKYFDLPRPRVLLPAKFWSVYGIQPWSVHNNVRRKGYKAIVPSW